MCSEGIPTNKKPQSEWVRIDLRRIKKVECKVIKPKELPDGQHKPTSI
jgi:hypothetical protein